MNFKTLILTALCAIMLFSCEKGDDKASAIYTDMKVNQTMTDPQGNMYLSGTFQGHMDFDPGEGTDMKHSKIEKKIYESSIFITKLNADGSYGWTITKDPAESFDIISYYPQTVVDSKGNVYLASQETELETYTCDESNDSCDTHKFITKSIYVQKYSSTGELLFEKKIEGRGENYGFQLHIDKNDRLYLSANMKGTYDLDPNEGAVAFNYEPENNNDFSFLFAIIILSENGEYITSKTFNNMYPLSISFDSLHNMYIYFWDNVTDTLSKYLTKLDTNLDVVWQQNMDVYITANGFKMTPDNRLFFPIDPMKDADLNDNNFRARQQRISHKLASFDSDGNYLGAENITNNNYELFIYNNELNFNKNNDIYFLGTGIMNDDASSDSGYIDINIHFLTILHYTGDGSIEQRISPISLKSTYFNSLLIDESNKFIVSGMCHDIEIPNGPDGEVFTNTGYGYFVTKYSADGTNLWSRLFKF